MFGARPTFGTSPSFGSSFGTSTPSSTFGTSTFGRPAFGAPATSSSTLFGTSTTGGNTPFGQSQTSGGNLFGSNTQSTAFGNNTTTSSTFGTSGGTMFGSNNPTTGLFGSSGTAFNSNQNATRPFSFGTSSASGTTGSGLFGNNTNTSGGTLFNTTIGGQTTGTTIKFNPVTSSDTMNRGGVSSNIQTKIEVITAMKEYENKSLEELRVEDYIAGRKGSTAQVGGGFGFGGNKFGTTQNTTPLFGQTSSSSNNMFGSKPQENKGAFGSSTGFSFNQPSSAPSFGMAQTNTQAGSAFGSSGFSFGNTSTPSTGPFGENKLSFGATGSSTNSGFFGTSKPTFGMSGTSGSSGVFGKPSAFSTGFGTPTAPAFGSTNTSTGTGLFSQNQTKPGFSFGSSTPGTFGTGSTGFGTSGGLFAQTATQNKPGALSFGVGLPFGTPSPSTGFGFNQNTGGGLLGSNTSGGFFANQNPGLNTSTTGFGTNFNSGFGMSNLQGTQQNMNAAVNNNNLNNLIKALTHNPFGNSSLLKSSSTSIGKADELLNAISTGDSTHEGVKNNIAKRPNYILPSSISIANIAKPIGINRISNGNGKTDPTISMLFAGLDDSSDCNSDDPFKPKFFPRVKKLALKVFKNRNNQSHDSSLINETSSIVASPITTPIGSPIISSSSNKGIETPTGRPFTASNGNTPTPDIIKGRNNIKNFSIARKMPFNDTLEEFNLPTSQKSLSEIEGNKENTSVHLLETSGFDVQPPALNESAMVPHPAEIKLTRSGYYTLPSLEYLKDMVDEDGKCLVENFTVGRYDYGNICFLGITDIHGMDLDSIVQIVRKEVEVYPEGTEKASIGEGLNKPALVTLDCVWPVDKTSREVIREEDRLIDMKWIDYLENHCMKMEASFVEYRLETGSWVFKVKHFSKYGLQDDEKQQVSICDPQKPPVDKLIVASSNSVIVTNTTDVPQSVTPIVNGSTKKKSNGPPALGLVSPPTLSRPSEDLVFTFTPPIRKVIMDDSLFPMDEDIVNEPELSILNKQEKKTVLQREARTEYPLVPCGKSGEQSRHHLAQHLQDKISQEHSLTCNLSTCISDAAAFMGRSFRVGWGPRLTLVHGGNSSLGQNMLTGMKQQKVQSPCDSEDVMKSFLFAGTTSQVKVRQVKIKEPFPISIEKLHLVDGENQTNEFNEEEINPMLKNYMETILEHCTIQSEDDFPQFAPKSGIDLLHTLASFSHDEENPSRLATVFHLCVALWGKINFYSPDLDGCSVYSEAQYRKEALSQWLENVSSEVVSKEVERSLESTVKDGYLDAVFSHMSVRQVSKACSIAQKHGDYHLALLLSQVCLGSEIPRQFISHQLEAWAESGADNYISDSRKALYSVIAGLPTHLGSCDKINTCIGLDWKRSLGLHYWYFSPATSTIGEGLDLYDKAAGLYDSMEERYCEEPIPSYAFECLQNLQVNYDICYHLIKLFVDPTHKLESILENSTITPDPLDFSGSWLIWCILHSIGFTRISETKANLLHLSYASVLESQGHWTWAAFVLLFIKEKHCREKEVEALLSRQLLIESQTEDLVYEEKEKFLIEKLKLSVRRLRRLKAFRARYLKLNDEEAWYLLMDRDFNKAHKLILHSIAPNAVINEDHTYLKSFLYKLRIDHSEIIDWSSGGAVYCAYIEILEQIEQLKATGEFSGREVERLRPKLLSLCSKLNNIKCPTAVHRVAVSEMSRVAVSVLRAILGVDPDAPRVLAQQVSSLPLTHECALEELNCITHQYLTGSAMET